MQSENMIEQRHNPMLPSGLAAGALVAMAMAATYGDLRVPACEEPMAPKFRLGNKYRLCDCGSRKMFRDCCML